MRDRRLPGALLCVFTGVTAAACSSSPSAPTIQSTPIATPAPTPTPAPEPAPTPTPTPTPEACPDCEAPVSNDAPPVRLTLRLYTIEDGFGGVITSPSPEDLIPVGWLAKLDVVAKDEENKETNGTKPIQWNWTNGFLVKVSGNHTHQRRFKGLAPGIVDVWVHQQGVDSNHITIRFGN